MFLNYSHDKLTLPNEGRATDYRFAPYSVVNERLYVKLAMPAVPSLDHTVYKTPSTHVTPHLPKTYLPAHRQTHEVVITCDAVR